MVRVVGGGIGGIELPCQIFNLPESFTYSAPCGPLSLPTVPVSGHK